MSVVNLYWTRIPTPFAGDVSGGPVSPMQVMSVVMSQVMSVVDPYHHAGDVSGGPVSPRGQPRSEEGSPVPAKGAGSGSGLGYGREPSQYQPRVGSG